MFFLFHLLNHSVNEFYKSTGLELNLVVVVEGGVLAFHTDRLTTLTSFTDENGLMLC